MILPIKQSMCFTPDHLYLLWDLQPPRIWPWSVGWKQGVHTKNLPWLRSFLTCSRLHPWHESLGSQVSHTPLPSCKSVAAAWGSQNQKSVSHASSFMRCMPGLLLFLADSILFVMLIVVATCESNKWYYMIDYRVLSILIPVVSILCGVW